MTSQTGSNRAKPGQTGPNRAKQGQAGINRDKPGQTGTNRDKWDKPGQTWSNLAKPSQMRSNGAKWGQIRVIGVKQGQTGKMNNDVQFRPNFQTNVDNKIWPRCWLHFSMQHFWDCDQLLVDIDFPWNSQHHS